MQLSKEGLAGSGTVVQHGRLAQAAEACLPLQDCECFPCWVPCRTAWQPDPSCRSAEPFVCMDRRALPGWGISDAAWAPGPGKSKEALLDKAVMDP